MPPERERLVAEIADGVAEAIRDERRDLVSTDKDDALVAVALQTAHVFQIAEPTFNIQAFMELCQPK